MMIPPPSPSNPPRTPAAIEIAGKNRTLFAVQRISPFPGIHPWRVLNSCCFRRYRPKKMVATIMIGTVSHVSWGEGQRDIRGTERNRHRDSRFIKPKHDDGDERRWAYEPEHRVTLLHSDDALRSRFPPSQQTDDEKEGPSAPDTDDRSPRLPLSNQNLRKAKAKSIPSVG